MLINMESQGLTSAYVNQQPRCGHDVRVAMQTAEDFRDERYGNGSVVG